VGIKIKAGVRHAHIPPGNYKVRVTEIRESTFINKRKTFEFHFEVAEGEFKGTNMRGFVNGNYESFSPYTKLHRWMLPFTKGDLESGDELDLDIFMNKILIASVADKISRKTGNIFSNVTEILGVHCEL
jgi:hypothetical protein